MKRAKGIWFVAVLLILAAALGLWLRPVSYFNGAMYLREALSGDKSRTVQVEGYRVHYLVAGPANGRLVVLVHGLGGSCEDWRNIAPALTRAGFRVYMPDLLGYGRSERPAGFSYSVPDEATLVIGFMDALGLGPVDLGGWSMGGWIVQLVAADAPGRVQRLMLFDSAGLDLKPDWNTNLFTPSSAQQLGQLDELLMPHPPTVPGFVARDILRISGEDGWVVKRALAAMLTGRSVTDSLLPQLRMPVLIVWGTLDRITPLNEGEKMHQLAPHSQLDLISGCGHLAPLQCARQITPEVVSFLEK
jgi:pimeloyl-ACP methyl ester carboxylesterase